MFFVALWLTICVLLGAMSGWYSLMARFPDRPEEALATFRFQSGYMGLVRMGGILKLAVCPSGLRVGIWRIFGPFDRDFLVPWSELRVEDRGGWFGGRTSLGFGRDPVGRLEIGTGLASRLAGAAGGRWPRVTKAG